MVIAVKLPHIPIELDDAALNKKALIIIPVMALLNK
jgi:hypothetical protein